MSIILADPRYNPSLQKDITSKTKLGPGITMAKFLGSRGNKTSFDFETDHEVRRNIARQLYLHAELIRMVGRDPRFAQQRLIVSESVWNPLVGETWSSDGITEKMRTGHAVAYQLIDQHGHRANDLIWDLAVLWKDYARFDKIILDYDTFTPPEAPDVDPVLTSQVIVEMPTVGHDYDANYQYKVETRLNGNVLSDPGIVEVLEP